ncbi:MAG TPA: spore germination protein GerW family protein [Jiangellaceae bacterium]
MDVQSVMSQARDAITVKRVFGEPYQAEGVTVIPAAKVIGGAGGGEGERPKEQEKGAGSGFGVVARPVGAYLIRGDQVSWRPAVDVNRIVLGGQVVVAIALLTIRAIVKARAHSRTR